MKLFKVRMRVRKVVMILVEILDDVEGVSDCLYTFVVGDIGIKGADVHGHEDVIFVHFLVDGCEFIDSIG